MRQYVSLRGRREFTLAVRRGRVVSSPALTIYAFSPHRSPAGPAKVGVVVTKKVGKAVVRNFVRRRCKAILDAAAVTLASGRWYVVQCRPAAATMPFGALRNQLEDAVRRAGQERKATSQATS